ncbi:MAG: hypothetical protein JXQ96_18910 [Cyclobacteriaceae bacterium]
MTTQEFTDLLEKNPSIRLQFEVEDGKFIEPTYHITEIKNVSIDSVDCGGNPDAYNQTIVQLWVNPHEFLRKPWSTDKALSIFNKVESTTLSDPDAEIFFEYGDENIRTSQFSVENINIDGNTLNVQLFTKPTACKPSLRSNGAVSCC